MTAEEIKQEYSMKDILSKCGLPHPNRAGFIQCPFHKGDREASMKIYAKDFNCFGCGANGDIFTFLQMFYGIPFKEAFSMLGGSYEKERETSRFYLQKKKAVLERRRQEQQAEEQNFKRWKRERLTQVCNVLQLCDNAEGLYIPGTDEWKWLLELKQKHEYKFQVLAFGNKEEQEEMRRLNE